MPRGTFFKFFESACIKNYSFFFIFGPWVKFHLEFYQKVFSWLFGSAFNVSRVAFRGRLIHFGKKTSFSSFGYWVILLGSFRWKFSFGILKTVCYISGDFFSVKVSFGHFLEKLSDTGRNVFNFLQKKSSTRLSKLRSTCRGEHFE